MQVLSWLLSIISHSSDSLIQRFLLWLILVPLVLGTSTGVFFFLSGSLAVFQEDKKYVLFSSPEKKDKPPLWHFYTDI